MNNRFKKFLASMLTVVMLLSMLPTSVIADETVEPTLTVETTVEPTNEPTDESTDEPVDEPTDEPADEPTDEPTNEPTDEPTNEPTDEPTNEPADEPTDEPTNEPTDEPTNEPANESTYEPTDEPSNEPGVELANIVCDHSAQNYREERNNDVENEYWYSTDIDHCVVEAYKRYCADCGEFIEDYCEYTYADHEFVDGTCICGATDQSNAGYTIITSVNSRWLEPESVWIDYCIASTAGFKCTKYGCALRKAGSSDAYITDYSTNSYSSLTIYEIEGQSIFEDLTPGTEYEYYFQLTLRNGSVVTTGLRTFTTPSKECAHANHDNDTYVNTEYRSLDSATVHEERDVYMHSCTDCGEELPNVYTEWAEKSHVFGESNICACGYQKVIELTQVQISNGTAVEGENLTITWDGRKSTAFLVDIKLLDGAPQYTSETEPGTVIGERIDTEANSTTIAVPNAPGKYIKVNVIGYEKKTGAQTEAAGYAYFEIKAAPTAELPAPTVVILTENLTTVLSGGGVCLSLITWEEGTIGLEMKAIHTAPSGLTYELPYDDFYCGAYKSIEVETTGIKWPGTETMQARAFAFDSNGQKIYSEWASASTTITGECQHEGQICTKEVAGDYWGLYGIEDVDPYYTLSEDESQHQLHTKCIELCKICCGLLNNNVDVTGEYENHVYENGLCVCGHQETVVSSVPVWEKSRVDIESEKSKVSLYYNVDAPAKYVRLDYEGYTADGVMYESATIGVYKVVEKLMAPVDKAYPYTVFKDGYIDGSLTGFTEGTISKLYLTVCDASGNSLSDRSAAYEVYCAISEESPETITLTANPFGEIIEGTTVIFTAESNSDSVTLYIDAFEEGTGNRYTAVEKEMSKGGTTFTADNKFTSAGKKIVWAMTADGTKSAEIEITVVPAEIKLDTPVYTGTTTATVGETIIFSWTAVDNATGYTAYVRPVNNKDDVTNLSGSISGQSVSHTFTESGSYNLEIYAIGEEGYGASDACNVTISVAEPVPCDHSGRNYRYEIDTTVDIQYRDTGDGANHEVIYSYICYCEDCEGFVSDGVKDEYPPKAPHVYDASGVCVCGATTATPPTCPVQLATPVVTLTGLDSMYEGDTTGVVWNKVPNATLYALYVWNDSNVVDYVEYTADAKLEYSHTFDKAGTYVIGVYACAPGSADYLQSEVGSVNVIITKKPTAKPAEIIGDVELKCEGKVSKAGERFRLTVVTNADTTRLVAVNNNSTGFQYPDAWTKTPNGDGTYTWTRSYKADVEAKGRYWTVTPYNADGIAGTAVKSNKVDIAPAVKDEWYTAYYKFNNDATQVPATNDTITIDYSVNKYVIIYAGDYHHPSRDGSPYYYKFSDESVLSTNGNYKKYSIDVIGPGSCTVEIWNKDTNKMVTTVTVNVVASPNTQTNSETILSATNTDSRKFAVHVSGMCGTQTLQNSGTLNFTSGSSATAVMFILSEYVDGKWQVIDTASEKEFSWNVSKKKGDVEEYSITKEGLFTSTSFEDQKYIVTLKYNDGTAMSEMSYTMNITMHENVKKTHYSLVSEAGTDCVIAKSAWGKSDSELPSIFVKDNYTGQLLNVQDGDFTLSIVENESTGEIWPEKLDIGKIEHKYAGTVYIDLVAHGVRQNTRFKVFCTNDTHISPSLFQGTPTAREFSFDLSPSNSDRYGVSLTINDIPDFAKNDDLYSVGYLVGYYQENNLNPINVQTINAGGWDHVKNQTYTIRDIPYTNYVSVLVYVKSLVDGSYLFSKQNLTETSYAHRYYKYLVDESKKERLSNISGEDLTLSEIKNRVENMSNSALRALQRVEYAGFLAAYVVETAEGLTHIVKSDDHIVWKTVDAVGLGYDYLDTIWKKELAAVIGIAFKIDGQKIELVINEADFWYGLAKNPSALKAAMHYFDDGINALEGEDSVILGGNSTGVNIFDTLGFEDYEMYLDPAKDLIYLIDRNNTKNIVKFGIDVSAGLQYLQDKESYTNAGVPIEIAEALALYDAEEVKDRYRSLVKIDRDVTGYVTEDYFFNQKSLSSTVKEAVYNPDNVFTISTASGVVDNGSQEAVFDEWVERDTYWYDD